MPYHLPDISEIMAVAETRGEDSDAPDLWRGLVGAWPLQEPGGLTAFDVSGYGQHGILANTETQDRVIRSQGRSIILDGVDESIEITQAAHLKPTAAISVSAWIHRLSGPTNYDGIFKGPSEGTKNTYMLVWYSDGFRWIIYDIAASQKYCLSNGKAPTTNEVHVVGTWDGATLKMYVDGVLQTNTAACTSIYYGTTNDPAAIGRNGTNYPFMRVWGFTVHSRALTPAEIQQLYADPWAMYRLRASVFPAAVAEPSGFKPYWARPSSQIIGGGIAA